MPGARDPIVSPDDEGLVEAGEPFLVANEFATIRVRKVQTRNGERLEVVNLRGGTRTLLDPMQLEIITLQPPETFTALLARTLGEKER